MTNKKDILETIEHAAASGERLEGLTFYIYDGGAYATPQQAKEQGALYAVAHDINGYTATRDLYDALTATAAALGHADTTIIYIQGL